MNTDDTGPLVSRSDYPALSRFLRGYLHEDYRMDHRSSTRAARAFCRVATEAERVAVAAELERFLEAVGADRQAIVEGIGLLGAGWRPRSHLSLQRLLSVIAGD